jgi:hypothetical protein
MLVLHERFLRVITDCVPILHVFPLLNFLSTLCLLNSVSPFSLCILKYTLYTYKIAKHHTPGEELALLVYIIRVILFGQTRNVGINA